MALLETPLKDETFVAKPFNLLGTDDQHHSLDSLRGENGTVIFFICNHCPYVKAIIDRLVEDAKTLQDEGFGVVAIMPNDTQNYPADSFDNMKIFADEHKFNFPYLIDETQQTAKDYGAICTPDIYGFNSEDKLEYRGRLDSAGKDEANTDTQKELLEAMKEIAQSGQSSATQFPSMGCSIKCKE